jgi:hypothetical protein
MFKDEIGERRLGQGYNLREDYGSARSGGRRAFDNYKMGNEQESSNANAYFDRNSK